MANLSDERKQRLEDLATAWRDAQATLAVHRNKLYAAVAEAIDGDGAPAKQVARTIGVSAPRVYAIIVAHYDETRKK